VGQIMLYSKDRSLNLGEETFTGVILWSWAPQMLLHDWPLMLLYCVNLKKPWWYRFRSSWTLCCADSVFTDIFMEHMPSSSEPKILEHGLIDSDEGNVFLQNVNNYLPLSQMLTSQKTWIFKTECAFKENVTEVLFLIYLHRR